LYRVHLGIRTQNLNIIKIGWKRKFARYIYNLIRNNR
jgi:hypothetical protein